MITAIALAEFAEKNGWIVIDKVEDKTDNYIRYLTPSGERVSVMFWKDGSIEKIYP